jgi:hypothetical protein
MSKLKTKWLEDNAISAAKIRLENDSFLRGRNFANTADLNLLKVNSSNLAEFGIEPTYVGVPTTSNSLVNRQYVLDVIAGIRDPKDAVRVASTVNVDLASMPAAVDTITLAVGDRFLAKNQTAPAQNGIYVFQGSGNAATRATDFDSDAEVTQGASCDVIEGTVNGNTRWLLTTPDPLIVGTTGLTFVKTPTALEQISFKRNVFVLSGTDITNGYVDLTNVSEFQSVIVWPDGGLPQRESSDFSLSGAGPGGVTRLTFSGDLASTLEATDVLIVNFAHF